MLKIELKSTKSQNENWTKLKPKALNYNSEKTIFVMCTGMQIGDVYGIFNTSVKLPLRHMQISAI